MQESKRGESEDLGTRYRVLCVSPLPEDHAALEQMLRGGNRTVDHAANLCGAQHLLKTNPYLLVICERDIPPESWKDVLVVTASLPQAPFFLVTSIHADDGLWAEALNWGAYDVLAKPFQAAEVVRVVSMAALHWSHRHPGGKAMVRRAAL